MKECKHGRGDCPGIRNCSGSFQDCEEPQPVTVFQGAEEFAKKLSRNGIIECGHEDCKACPEHLKEWIKDIESRDAAQRQAGFDAGYKAALEGKE